MANVDDAVVVFTRNIEKANRALLDDLEKVAFNMSKMTEAELVRTTRQINFFQELIDRGYGESVDNLINEYDGLLASAVAEAKRRGIAPLSGASVEALQTLKDLDTEALLGRASMHSSQLKSALFSGIYGGQTTAQVIASLQNIPLATHQINVLATDGIRRFDDFSRVAVFKDSNVRWTYIGPQDDRTRDACKDTKFFEPAKGYKAKDIPKETPFGLRGGFNCRHSWMVK